MRNRIIAATLTTGLALTGCGPTAPDIHPSMGPTPEPVATMHVPRPPDTLPESIRAVVPNVVSISLGIVGNAASGVRYRDIVLTAGHAVIDNQGDANLKPGLGNCYNLTAIGAGEPNGSEAAPDRIAGTFTSNRDLGAFTLSSLDNGLPSGLDFPLASAPPAAGDVVYFVNFQPEANHEARSPRIGSDPAHHQPAIYAEVVLPEGSSKTPGQIPVLTGLQSYGAIPDTNSREVSSGGAVFEIVNGRAELVGLSVTGIPYPLSPADVLADTGVQPVGDFPDPNNLGYTGVQPVTEENIATLKQQLAAAQPCTWPPQS